MFLFTSLTTMLAAGALVAGFARVQQYDAQIEAARNKGLRVSSLLDIALDQQNFTDFDIARADQRMCEQTGLLYTADGCQWTKEACLALGPDMIFSQGKCFSAQTVREGCAALGLGYVAPTGTDVMPRCEVNEAYCTSKCMRYDPETKDCFIDKSKETFVENNYQIGGGKNMTRRAEQGLGLCGNK
jgi:hypothetical protein